VPLAEVPAFGEQGFTGFDLPAWSAASCPARTPQRIVERMSRALAAALRKPELRARLLAIRQLPIGNTAADFAARYAAECPGGRR
jgi:tripartite-type tricarboxylate transporter receptor subunit TctC